MMKITLIEDLSKKNLCEVPRTVLHLTNLKMLYLEGNELKSLPEEMFITLDKLQWLDVRNNKLTSIPKTIMDHLCLETILLQNNNIHSLPLEMGFIPNLKVLQLAGNPIIYPDPSIMELGLKDITIYLRNEYIAQETAACINQQPQKIVNSTTKSDSQISDQISKTIDSTKEFKVDIPIITLKSYHKIPEKSKRSKMRFSKLHYKKRKYNIYEDTVFQNSNKYLCPFPSLTGKEDKIKEQAMKDMFLKKMKEMLNHQEEELQKERDRETLKKWRQSIKYKKNADVNYRPEIPYDYNKEYDKMPSRKDINKFIKKGSSDSIKSTKPKKINVEKLIADIVESLKLMEKERSTEKTPIAQMDYAGREIRRILDLQKRLSALKVTNDQNL